MHNGTYLYSFPAFDINGQGYSVEVFERHTPPGKTSDTRPRKGLYFVTGQERDRVFRIEKGKYRIQCQGCDWILTSDDPNAP